MRFPVYFKRSKNVAGIPALGSDTAPTVASVYSDKAAPAAPGDNILSHKLSRPINRIAVGWWYQGAGAAPASLPITLWVFDATSGRWFAMASGTLTNGVITYLKCSALCDPPQTQANILAPQHGMEVLLIVSDNAGADGTYHFVAGPDSSVAS